MKKSIVIPFLLIPFIGSCGNTPTSLDTSSTRVDDSGISVTSVISEETSTSTEEEVFYSVTVQNTNNGTITADKDRVKQGDFVTFSIRANDGYELGDFKVNGTTTLVELDHYTVFNVQEDLTITATFVANKITIRYFNNDELLMIRKVTPGEDASYFGKTPVKASENGKVFEFQGWSLVKEGELIDSFIFNESTDLYSVFKEKIYHFEMPENLALRTMHTIALTDEITTDYPEDILSNGLIIEDSTICSINKDLVIEGLKKGETNLNFVVGGVVIATSHISVTNIDNVRTKLCYASGAVEYNDDYSVGRYKACQTLITDLEGNNIQQKYIDFEGDFRFDASLSTADNFGIQFNKENYSSGSIKSGFMFGGTTGSNSNIYLKVNGTAQNTASYTLVANKVYNFHIITTEGSASGKIHIECYIDGNKLIDTEKDEVNSATNYIGFRYANSKDSQNYINFSNLYLK